MSNLDSFSAVKSCVNWKKKKYYIIIYQTAKDNMNCYSRAPARQRRVSAENLVTHRSQKFWLSRDCPYVHPYVRTSIHQVLYIEKIRVAPLPSLIFDIHVMIDWQLSKQGIRWPVSHDHIAGSRRELIEVVCFFEVDRWLDIGFLIGSWAQVRLFL